jgi:chloramphenicol 3-O-phosphotransferase
VRRSLAADRSVIAEANFSRGTAEPHFHALPPHRTVQIHCHAPLDVLLARYGARPVRHPGHLDGVRAGELVDRFADDAHGPLALDGELIELDTSRPVDVEALAERLRRLL